VTTGEKMKESSIIWGFVVLLLALSSVEAGSCVDKKGFPFPKPVICADGKDV